MASGRGDPAEETELVLEVTDLAFGGRGVARTAQGLVVFVEGGLAGESVRARIVRRRAGYAEAVVLEILRASPDRVVPPCEHYGECGGCDLQHLRPEAQARAKREQVAAILSRIAGLQRPPVRDTIVAEEAWGYRFRMDFDWIARPSGGALGLHRRGRPAEIVPIRRCHLMTERGNRILSFLASAASARRLDPWDPARRRGLLRRATLQEARSTEEILITLETARGDPPALRDLAADLVRRFPRVVGVVRREIDRQGRLVEESIFSGRDHLYEEIDGDRFRVPAGAFFQPNTCLSGRLRQEVMEALDPRKTGSVLELYCGVGFFTLALARRAGEVVALEGSREAVRAARENVARGAIGEVRLICGEVSDALPELLREKAWDGLLVDPPRAGLPRGAAASIAASQVQRLVYVSCDPATLARDLRILTGSGRFRLDSVTPLDLFPQTHHIECVARLERQPAS